MPTYEYQCPSGHEFELFQKMSDKPRAKCPSCGRIAARKISGGAGLVFKGSGFYITDYGKDGKGPRKEGEKAETTGKGDKPGTTEPKPESSTSAKADAKPPKEPKQSKKAPKSE
jgi:putative FmdB family regulatory protein